jgi:cyclophilin family peptidyl-prolyl cis-trans isomerase
VPKPYIVKFGDPNTKTKDLDDDSIETGGSGERIAYEKSGFKNEVGSVALSTPPKDRDGGDSQFFVNLAQNRFLDGEFTVFGKVVGGSMKVVDKIQKGDRVTKATILVGPPNAKP